MIEGLTSTSSLSNLKRFETYPVFITSASKNVNSYNSPYSFLNCLAISRTRSGRKIGINRINNRPCLRSFSLQIRVDPRPVASSIDGQSSCFSAHIETVLSGKPSLSDNSLLVYDAIDPHGAP